MRQIKQGAKWTHGHIVVVNNSDIKFERFDLIYSLLFEPGVPVRLYLTNISSLFVLLPSLFLLALK